MDSRLLHGYHRALIQVSAALFQDLNQKTYEFVCSEPFDAHADHGWFLRRRTRQMRMEIRIESNNSSFLSNGVSRDLVIQRLCHSDFAGVHRIESCLTQQNASAARSALIEQQFLWPSAADS